MANEDKLQLAKEALASGTYDKETIEYIFPELRESEDEKIRKALINKIKSLDEEEAKEGYSFYADDYTADDCIAWLEKQGEQILANSCKTCKDEQKPYWSEEDERMLSGLISIVEGWYNTMSEEEKEYYGDCGYINWINSIKDRVQPQPKQEWSEEDEYQINTILHGLDLKRELYKKEGNQVEEKRYKTQYDWLKSLKSQNRLKSSEVKNETKNKCPNYSEGYGCSTSPLKQCDTCPDYKLYNHWKPSEEQMEAIKYFIDFHKPQANASIEGWNEFNNLESLYNDIQKL